MEEFESATEEHDNNYEEKETIYPGNGESFPFEEVVTVAKIEQ